MGALEVVSTLGHWCVTIAGALRVKVSSLFLPHAHSPAGTVLESGAALYLPPALMYLKPANV
jgi:hypothetical protein